jgi:iron complex outermembrane receptor protein
MKRLACLLSLWAACLAALAESALPERDLYALPLDELLRVQTPAQAEVGSRTGARSALEAIVPTDVYTAQQLQSVGYNTLAQALAALVPGFNYPRPSIADGTDHAPPFTLRSLNPDQVLVLVNGKRQHHSALLHTNGTIGRGSSGVDLNTIPLLAVERVEVLRDGAAAQYGSDAIAGIINIVLKGYGHASQAQLGWGRTSQGDGLQRQAALFHATPLAGDGFINLTAELRDRGPTNRAGPDALDGGRINTRFGDADTQDALLAWNAELPRGDTTWYAHGHFNRRNSSAGAFFRRADDERNLPQLYPQGFLPRIEPRITNLSAALGAKGVLDSGTRWNLAYTGGFNDFHFYVANSLNRSLGLGSPTAFDSGATALAQHTLHADLSHHFGPHTLSGGYEYRAENYRIRQGELASYQLGPESSWYPGAQGFGGFSPENEVRVRRHSHALYADLNYALAPQLVLNAATRAAHYSDFGSALNGKLALRLRPAEHWLLRTSVSNGFRAPSLAQSHFTSTAMVRDGEVISQYGSYGVDHPVARALGATDLKPEKSQHFTLGAVWQPTTRFSASVDGFVTGIYDRIMPTGYIAGWNLARLSPQALAILQQNQVDGASYFTNAVATRTRGIDLRLDYQHALSQGRRWHLSAAWQRAATRIRHINRAPPVLGVDMTDLILDPYTRVTMEAGQPRTSLKLWTQYSTPGYDLAFNLNRFGSYASTYGDTPVRFGARWTLDVQFNFHWNKNTTLTVGGTNVLNTRPSQWGATSDSLNGTDKVIPYSQYAPFGYNGAAYYVRLGVRF